MQNLICGTELENCVKMFISLKFFIWHFFAILTETCQTKSFKNEHFSQSVAKVKYRRRDLFENIDFVIDFQCWALQIYTPFCNCKFRKIAMGVSQLQICGAFAIIFCTSTAANDFLLQQT